MQFYEAGEAATAGVATGSPIYQARLQLARGRLLRRTGQRRLAVDWLRRADQAYQALRAAPFITRAETELAACRLEGPASEGEPLVIAQFRELADEQLPQRIGCLLIVSRPRQLADIALDPRQALALDYRPDVVEYAAGNRARACRAEQHRQNAPARRADEDGAANLQSGEDGQNVGELGRQIVVRGVAIVFRLSAAAGIEREHMARCPRTAAALEQVPLAHTPNHGPTVNFSLLAPHTQIPPHTGSTNVRLIVHLPLIVPKGCTFRVGNETREWEEGKAWVFDDTIEHEALNPSDQLRVILIVDTWHPDLSESERTAVAAMMAATDSPEGAGL